MESSTNNGDNVDGAEKPGIGTSSSEVVDVDVVDQVNRQFDEVCLNELVSDDDSNCLNDVHEVNNDPIESPLPVSVPTSPINGSNQDNSSTDGHRVATIRSISSASNSSQEIMYSAGNTPLSTPVKVPKSLPESDKLLLVEMEQQNQVLDSVKLVEEKYQKKIEEMSELSKTEEEIRHKLEDQIKKLQETVEKQQEEFAATISDVKSRLGSKLDQMSKAAETSKKDLESMVSNQVSKLIVLLDYFLNCHAGN